MTATPPLTAEEKKKEEERKNPKTSVQVSSAGSSGNSTYKGLDAATDVVVLGGLDLLSAAVPTAGSVTEKASSGVSESVFSAKQAVGSLATDTNAQAAPVITEYATVAASTLTEQAGSYATVDAIGGPVVDSIAANTDASVEGVTAVADSGFFDAAGEAIGSAMEVAGEAVGAVAEGAVEIVSSVVGGLF